MAWTAEFGLTSQRNSTLTPKIIHLLAVLAPLVIVFANTACAADPKPDDDGYVHLFNGKNLDGWTFHREADDFKVSDGVIRSEFGGGAQLMYYTDKTFSDFELVVEWRVSAGGNSGVFVRAPKDGWPWETAYEIQISNEQPPRDDSHCTGSLYGYAAVQPRPDETPEKWRQFVITCKGETISVEVDGEKVVSFEQSSMEETKDKPLSGFIGVQDCHGPEGTWIEYRTIKVRPLD